MVHLSSQLLDYLTSSDRPKQVLVTVHGRTRPLSALAREDPFASHALSAEQNRLDLIQALHRERERDARVQFNPLAAVDQIALEAPPALIVRMAARPDVADIVLDEPEKVLDDPPGSSPARDSLDVDVGYSEGSP